MGSKQHSSRNISSLLRKPWLFASAVFGLDIAMLVIGLVLSGRSGEGIVYTANGDSIVKDDPLSFFGVIAAVVLGINCVLIALILAGAFTRSKRRGGVIAGSAGLLLVSLAMVASSAFMVLGAPVKSEKYYSYTDETLRLIVEETKPYFGEGTASFYMTNSEENGNAILLARTGITDYADSAERYTIAWNSESILTIGFADGTHYRTLTITVDRSLLEKPKTGDAGTVDTAVS